MRGKFWRLSVRVVGVLFITFALLAGLIWVETNALQVEQVVVPIIGLPPELDGLRIALISDLHGRKLQPNSRLVQTVQGSGVDLIAAAGDFVDRDTNEMANVLPLMQALTGIAPVYAVSGNHDYWADWPIIAGQLRQVGVTVLENSSVILKRGNAVYCLAGVADHYSGQADLEQAIPEQWEGPIILLSHSPTLFDPGWGSNYLESGSADWPVRQQLLQRVSLTLSGHTHGGQIKIPFIGALSNATGEWFPKQHVQGLSQEQHGWLYISRGLGTTGLVRARFLSRPELTILTLLMER